MMDKRKIGGALLLFIGAFVATRQLLSKGDWTVNHYIILGCCAVLIGIGVSVITKKPAGK